MDIFNTKWMIVIALLVCFTAVFILTHNSKWPNTPMYGMLAGTLVGLIGLTFIPNISFLLLAFGIGTILGYLFQLIKKSFHR